MTRTTNKGFTLIELLIVVAIIAILAAIAVPNFLEAQVRSKVSRAKNDLRAMATALESYAVDTNKYPPNADFGADPPVVTNSIDSSEVLKWLTTPVAYITSLEACRDVFTQGRQVTNTYAPGIPPYDQDYFVYYNYVNRATLQGVPERAFRGWGLASMGPNAADDAVCFRLFNFVAYPEFEWAQSEFTVSAYDPTNGTISEGDIARFGGDIPAKAREIAGY